LHFGVPAEDHGAYRGGLPRLIATPALRHYWEVRRTRSWGVNLDLPAGHTTLKRVRRRLGFNYRTDMERFWRDHIQELESLPIRVFAARYGVDATVAKQKRLDLLGRRARRIGWWRHPVVGRVLLSRLPLRTVGEILEISISQAHRLRNKTRRLALAC
jgi:hypothetical protein